MGGWKGKVGGIGAMLGGVAGLLVGFSNGTLSSENLMQFISIISLGLSTFGIRSAIGPGIQGAVPIQTPTVKTGPAPVG